MRKGFTVKTEGMHPDAKVVVVSNYIHSNIVVNYRFTSFNKEEIMGTDIGMWRIKTLKN
jgi:malate/lactate dehydrogenase